MSSAYIEQRDGVYMVAGSRVSLDSVSSSRHTAALALWSFRTMFRLERSSTT